MFFFPRSSLFFGYIYGFFSLVVLIVVYGYMFFCQKKKFLDIYMFFFPRRCGSSFGYMFFFKYTFSIVFAMSPNVCLP